MSPLTAIDLFSGAGGTTQGLTDAGYNVLCAVENDETAAKTFRLNHASDLLVRDITKVQAPALARRLKTEVPLGLLTACPPCQPFSTLGSGDANDPRNGLVSTILRFVVHLQPRAIMLENVPGLQHEPRFVRLIAELGKTYDLRQYLVQATDFGVPQNRRRIIVIGIAKGNDVRLPDQLAGALPPSFNAAPTTAGEALAAAMGLDVADDPVHRARKSTPMTVRRIMATTQGGGRTELPPELQLECHKRLDNRSATSIYGRIDPNKPAPTMTTRCTTPSCGRFVHPTEHRGLTLREAALLQTFPMDYRFFGTHGEVERQIGNAVPPQLAQGLGLIVSALLAECDRRSMESGAAHAA